MRNACAGIVCAVAALMLASMQAFSTPYQFVNLSTQNSGLSFDTVNKINQDSRGFIWIGTAKGVNRYDGTSFRVYDREDLGLSSDYVFCIEEDRKGNIWVGTDSGVSCYDYEKDMFVPFSMVSDKGAVIRNKVTFIHIDHDGAIWFLVNNQGMFQYDQDAGVLKMYPYSAFGNGIIGFRKMLHLRDGGFLMSCYHLNLFLADEKLTDFKPVPLAQDMDYFLSDEIEGLFEGKDGMIYVASTKNGLSRYCRKDSTVVNIFTIPSSQTLVDAFMDDDGFVWLSTTGGLWRVDTGGSGALQILHDRDDEFSIAGNYVLCSFVDRDNGIWVGTKDCGISFCGTGRNKFTRLNRASGKSLRGAIVRFFSEDSRGNVWASTEQYGLLKYNPAAGMPEIIDIKNVPRTIFSLCHDEPYLWIGSIDGLYRLDTRSGAVRDFGVLERKSRINDPRVELIFKTSDGRIFASNTLGLFEYDRGADKFIDVEAFDGLFMTGVAEDKSGSLWFSTYARGVFRWAYREGALPQHFSSADECGLEDDKVSSVFVDSSDRVWVLGFSHGFAQFDRKTSRFRVYNRSNLPSLPSDVCQSMQEDDEGRLWISTDKGLAQFDPETEDIRVYTMLDGLLDNKLSKGSLKSRSGDIYIGSDNGFVTFRPSSLYQARQIPEVVVTGISVAGREMHSGRNPDLMESLELGRDENSFGFAFSFPGPLKPASFKVQCCLEGYDDQWRDILGTRSVFFYNVPAGHYSLKVRASVSPQEWTEAHAPLNIYVNPGFWASVWGLSLIVLIAFSLMAATFAIIEVRSSRHHRKMAEQYRKAKDEESFQDKMNFFSHVIHEIKTPLTLIRTPLMNVMAKDGFDEESRHDLEVMRNSADYLSKLVNELLDFVRVEKSGYVLKPERIDMVEELRSMIFDYEDTARNANIALNFSPEVKTAYVNADKSALCKILNNVLLNAIKYAESHINVVLSADGGKICLKVSNDGNHIPEDQREEIFKPFVQAGTQSAPGVGIGLPLARNLARMHSGDLVLDDGPGDTCFVLVLPSAPEVLEDDGEDDVREEEDTGRMRILVADDNPDLRDYLSLKLSDNYDVTVAADGDAAMSAIRSQNIDMVLTDISMPGKTGLEICREIRDDIEISHLPVIILSARSSIESKIQAMESGADLYIEKPFDLEYLRSSIRNILDRRQLMKTAAGRGIATGDVAKYGLPKRDTEFFEKFDSLIRENLSAPDLNVEWIAENLAMSPSTLTRKIRKLINTTPNNYIRSVRLSIAADMLKNSDGNNVTDICYAVGFSNLSYFAKCFKNQYGKIPTEFSGKIQ